MNKTQNTVAKTFQLQINHLMYKTLYPCKQSDATWHCQLIDLAPRDISVKYEQNLSSG